MRSIVNEIADRHEQETGTPFFGSHGCPKIIKNTYFKLTHDEHINLMSGVALPDPDKGPYNFHNCSFHPRLWSAIQQMYSTSVLSGTSYAGPRD